MNSHEVFIHIHQGCFAGTGAIVRLPQCQWSKPDGYGKISQCITTTRHSKAKTVCIFLGVYCMFWETSLMIRHMRSCLVSKRISFLVLFSAPVVGNYVFDHLTHNVAKNTIGILYGQLKLFYNKLIWSLSVLCVYVCAFFVCWLVGFGFCLFFVGFFCCLLFCWFVCLFVAFLSCFVLLSCCFCCFCFFWFWHPLGFLSRKLS